jgi:hypothetical protein
VIFITTFSGMPRQGRAHLHVGGADIMRSV